MTDAKCTFLSSVLALRITSALGFTCLRSQPGRLSSLSRSLSTAAYCIWNLYRFVDGRACASGRNGIQTPGSCTPVCLPERPRRAAFSGWRSNDLWHALKNPDSHPPFSCRRSHDVCGILDGDFSKLSTFESGVACRLLLSSISEAAVIGR